MYENNKYLRIPQNNQNKLEKPNGKNYNTQTDE
jgi:hypothetical protein